MNLFKRDKSFLNFIICLVSVIFICICYFTYQFYKPYPLGDANKLQYIGKVDYGCWLICDSNPASTYYYATDLNLDQVTKTLFTKASLYKKPEFGYASGKGADDVRQYWIVYGINGDWAFDAYFYDNPRTLISGYHFATNKQHVISIDSESYDLVKNSL